LQAAQNDALAGQRMLYGRKPAVAAAAKSGAGVCGPREFEPGRARVLSQHSAQLRRRHRELSGVGM
jgi:hypothetical protein